MRPARSRSIGFREERQAFRQHVACFKIRHHQNICPAGNGRRNLFDRRRFHANCVVKCESAIQLGTFRSIYQICRIRQARDAKPYVVAFVIAVIWPRSAIFLYSVPDTTRRRVVEITADGTGIPRGRPGHRGAPGVGRTRQAADCDRASQPTAPGQQSETSSRSIGPPTPMRSSPRATWRSTTPSAGGSARGVWREG